MSKRSVSVALWMCGLAALFYAYEDILRVLPGTLTHQLFVDLHVDAKELGFMAALFYVGYAPMQIPAGLLLDRYGARRCLLTAALVCVVATMVFAWTPLFWVLSVSRFWIGVASSVAYLASIKLITRWFDAKHFVLMTGLVQLLGCMGALIGQAPVAWMLGFMPWRHVVFLISLGCLFLAGLYYTSLRDAPNQYVLSEEPKASMSQLWAGLVQICKQSQTWWVATYAFLIWAPIAVFAVMWGVSFFHVSYHMTITQGGILLSAVWIGVSLGGPLFGWLTQWLKRRCVLMAVAGLMGAVPAFLIVYDPSLGNITLWALLFMFGLASSAQAVSFGVVFDRQPHSLMGVASGFNNLAVVMGGFVLQPLVGWMISHHATGEMAGAAPVYHLQDFQYALWILPCCYLLAAMVAWFLIKETYCQSVHHG